MGFLSKDALERHPFQGWTSGTNFFFFLAPMFFKTIPGYSHIHMKLRKTAWHHLVDICEIWGVRGCPLHCISQAWDHHWPESLHSLITGFRNYSKLYLLMYLWIFVIYKSSFSSISEACCLQLDYLFRSFLYLSLFRMSC